MQDIEATVLRMSSSGGVPVRRRSSEAAALTPFGARSMFAHPDTLGGIVSMLWDAGVFSVDGDEYHWRDVIVAAVRWGEWAKADRRTRQGIAAMSYSEETSDPLPAGTLDTAAKEFR